MAITFNADTTNGAVITSDTSGEIKLQSAGADIATINSSGITMASGKAVSGGEIIQNAGPAFSAYMTGTQSFTTSILTKVTYNTEAFDTASCYDTSNYRFTPNVAGYYWVKSVIVFSGSSGVCNLWLFINGGQNKIGGQIPLNSNAVSVNFSELVYLNGSTDYIEMYSSQNTGSTASNLNLGTLATFQAYLARAA